jgi:hypothetical protein
MTVPIMDSGFNARRPVISGLQRRAKSRTVAHMSPDGCYFVQEVCHEGFINPVLDQYSRTADARLARGHEASECCAIDSCSEVGIIEDHDRRLMNYFS